MFGIANQMLAVIALAVVTTVMINAGRGRYAPLTILPMLFVITTHAHGRLPDDRQVSGLDHRRLDDGQSHAFGAGYPEHHLHSPADRSRDRDPVAGADAAAERTVELAPGRARRSEVVASEPRSAPG